MESLPATLPPIIPVLQDINKLLSLIKASIVSSSSTPNNSTPHGASASHEKHSPTPETIDLSREAKHQYRTAILAQKVKLTSSDILRSVNNDSSHWSCMLTLDLRTQPQVVKLRSVNNESSRFPCLLKLDLRTRPQVVRLFVEG